MSAALLTWRYCFQQVNAPDIVEYISLWDTWQWEGHDLEEEIEAIQFYLRSLGLTPESDWERLFDMSQYASDTRLLICLREGQAIVNFQKQQNALAVENAFETFLANLPVLALNSTMSSSIIFDSVKGDYPHVTAFLTFKWTKGHWVCGLYSNGDFDISQLARVFGGNGHKGAAGFVCDELPFELK